MASGQQKWVIAHRGASGYLPENTLPAFAMAHGLGCDWIELDVILSQDDQPIVLHDPYLDRLTDVNQRFPGRQRQDNLSYALDFPWKNYGNFEFLNDVISRGIQLFLDAFFKAIPALKFLHWQR